MTVADIASMQQLPRRSMDKLLGHDDYYNKLVEDERQWLVQQQVDKEFYAWDNYGND